MTGLVEGEMVRGVRKLVGDGVVTQREQERLGGLRFYFVQQFARDCSDIGQVLAGH